MFPQKNRIRKADFKRIFREAKAIRTIAFTLLFAVNEKLKEPQFAVVVSTKVEPKATKRNRIKRQIREILQKEMENISSNIQIITICKPEITKLKFDEIQKLIIDAVKQLPI